MAKPKPKPKIDIEFEWVDNGDNVFPKVEYVRKSRLKCCPDIERMSNTWGPFYFTDKHYPVMNVK